MPWSGWCSFPLRSRQPRARQVPWLRPSFRQALEHQGIWHRHAEQSRRKETVLRDALRKNFPKRPQGCFPQLTSAPKPHRRTQAEPLPSVSVTTTPSSGSSDRPERCLRAQAHRGNMLQVRHIHRRLRDRRSHISSPCFSTRRRLPRSRRIRRRKRAS